MNVSDSQAAKPAADTLTAQWSDLQPYVPPHYRLVKHEPVDGTGQIVLTRTGNELQVNGKKVELYQSKRQTSTSGIAISELLQEIGQLGKRSLNVCVLSCLDKNRKLIPEKWPKEIDGVKVAVLFTGTVIEAIRSPQEQEVGRLFPAHMMYRRMDDEFSLEPRHLVYNDVFIAVIDK